MIFKDQFNNWMQRLNDIENLPANIIAFNFGLFESIDGYMLYIIGTKNFEEENDDWATIIDYEPEEKYLKINSEETNELEWHQVLEKVKLVIKNYIKSKEFEDSILRNAEAITLGFDDGDLERIK